MDVSQRVASKIERALEARLLSARPDESLRIVARLASPTLRPPEASPKPDEFASREEWRRELVNRQRSVINDNLGPVLERLRRLGITILAGGEISETVVLTGLPVNIVKALELDGVTHADIDQPLSL